MVIYNQKPLMVVKGRIKTIDENQEDNIIKKRVDIIAEKITFLSSKKSETIEEEK